MIFIVPNPIHRSKVNEENSVGLLRKTFTFHRISTRPLREIFSFWTVQDVDFSDLPFLTNRLGGPMIEPFLKWKDLISNFIRVFMELSDRSFHWELSPKYLAIEINRRPFTVYDFNLNLSSLNRLLFRYWPSLRRWDKEEFSSLL